MKIEISIKGRKLYIDLTDDFYGESWWRNLESLKYEPDTLNFIERETDANTIFLDIGVANGGMTLMAALCGAIVYSYEPFPTMFEVTKRNIELNIDIKNRIQLKNVAISSRSGKIFFSKEADSKILSSIVFPEKITEQVEIEVLSLKDEIEKLTDRYPDKKIVIKMDIEGAEWETLSDNLVLNSLRECNALLLIALHPGFHRPFISSHFGFQTLKRNFWRAKNFRDCYKLYVNLSAIASVRRTNLDLVPNAFKFALLVTAGYFEFIVHFREDHAN